MFKGMADNSVVLLDALLEERERLRGGPQLPADEAFELFSFEQCLKEYDLSEDEIANGQVGGGDDGGIDGLYCFLNANLVEEDAEVLEETFDPTSVRREPELLLVIIQAKTTASFAETPFDKLAAALKLLLDLSKTDEELEQLFSSPIVERIGVFRKTWQKLATRHPRIHVKVNYASKGHTSSINPKVNVKANQLATQITEAIPKATAEAVFLGARELVDLAGQEKTYTLSLSFQENATAADSHIVLVSLDDYYAFIADNGVLRKHIFDWNVRDYEGPVEVNKEIADSLGDPDAPEFWWLNNGVTVICSRASTTGRIFSLDDVQIVNGLQTSETIFRYLREATSDDPARGRSILVRIIVTDDHGTRDKVIRATNRQTAVPVASLRASDQIQRDLERYFLSADWFYERRKNYYRNQGKTPSKTVSIPYLAQATMAIGLSEPSNSRARPSSLLKRDTDYARIFDSGVDFAIFLWLAKVQKRVDEFLRSDRAKATATERTNLRFYVSMLLVATKYGGRVFNTSQLKALCGTQFSDDEIMAALDATRDKLTEFQQPGGAQVDKLVKNRDFTDYLFAQIFGNKNATDSAGASPGPHP